MKQKVITARVSVDIYAAVAEQASAEGVSLSAIAARLLTVGLAKVDKKPDWAVDIERRVAQLEQQAILPTQDRGKGKRRR